MLHFWRAAMASIPAVPETISSSQARPRAIDLISAVRRSAFIGRGRDLAVEAGSRVSLNLLAGGFVQGINSAEFSSIVPTLPARHSGRCRCSDPPDYI